MVKNLSSSITYDKTSKKIIQLWNSVIHDILMNHISHENTISPVAANMYRFDLHGLFVNELGIAEEFVYPTLRVNGFDSSNCYIGNQLTFKIPDISQLAIYYKLFTRENR